MKGFAALMIILALILSGCVSETPITTPSTAGPAFPITIQDNHGQNVTVDAPPQRIVSLAPSNTEILFALGLGERIVGVTEYCDYPEEAQKKEKIGGFKTVNIEKVVSLKPDLVLATGGVQGEVVEKLKGLGLSVMVMDAKNIDEIMQNILLVGKVTVTDGEAESLVQNMESRIEAVEKKAHSMEKKPKVAYILWGDPLMVAGKDTFINDLIDLAGGINVFSDSPTEYPTVSIESMIERNPDILINGDHSNMDFQVLKNDTEWSEINAVKNNRLYTVDADIVSRQGPRIIDALEKFSHWISEE